MPVNTYGGLSTDTTLGGSNPSDVLSPSQKAIKTYVDNNSGGGSVAIDNKSITKNSSNEIQTVGVIDQRNTANAIKTWTGTKAQYDAIVTKDSNTLYNITDDTNPTQALLEAIYPVGSIYIGTMNVCPMSALFGTWTIISSSVVVSLNNAANVVGNGMAIGITTDGTNNGVIGTTNADNTLQAGSATNANLPFNIGSGSLASGRAAVGLSKDGSKSGIIADTSSLANSITVNIWERTA